LEGHRPSEPRRRGTPLLGLMDDVGRPRRHRHCSLHLLHRRASEVLRYRQYSIRGTRREPVSRSDFDAYSARDACRALPCGRCGARRSLRAHAQPESWTPSRRSRPSPVARRGPTPRGVCGEDSGLHPARGRAIEGLHDFPDSRSPPIQSPGDQNSANRPISLEGLNVHKLPSFARRA